MEKDTLFLMTPDFMDGTEGPYYCPDSLPIEGLLSYYPRLRGELDVHYVGFSRPRRPVIDLLGADHQGVPVLVLARNRPSELPGVRVSAVSQRHFIDDPELIRCYLTTTYYGVARPH